MDDSDEYGKIYSIYILILNYSLPTMEKYALKINAKYLYANKFHELVFIKFIRKKLSLDN